MNEKKLNNPMRQLDIEKVTINISTSTKVEDVERALKLLKKIVPDQEPTKVRGKKRVQQWGVRPGIPKGAMITLRGERAKEVLNKLLDAVDRRIDPKSFDNHGNFSFGIKEYLLIPGIKYDPEIGVLGMDVSVSLKRKGGWRVKYRKLKRARIPERHKIKKEEAIEWVKNNLNVEVAEKEERLYI
jgi:large subunit ribosomal protein L5